MTNRDSLAVLTRRVLVAVTVIPVLAITIVPTLYYLNGYRVLGPAPDSIFTQMPRALPTVVPLFCVCAGLLVHAFRERLPDYAFVVGLGGNVIASLMLRASGYWYAPFDVLWLPLLQANTIAFGVVALLWLMARRRLYGERGTGLLMEAQVSFGLLGNLVLVAAVVIPLIVDPTGVGRTIIQAGHWRGWLALALAGLAAWGYCGATGRRRFHLGMGLSLAVGVLVAAMAVRVAKRPWWPVWLPERPWLAIHILCAWWLACGIAVFWWKSDPRPSATAESRALEGWLTAIIGMVLALTLRTYDAGDPWSPWWAAGVAVGSGLLAVMMAVWQRRGDWAFAAGLCLNLAVSLVCRSVFCLESLDRQWVWLVQANVITSAATACSWLLILWRLHSASAWLAGQVILGALGNLVLLGHAAFWLIARPDGPPDSAVVIGGASGWAAFVAALVPLCWWTGLYCPARKLMLFAGSGMALSVLIAATVARWSSASWLAYHVLAASWAAVGAVVLLTDWGLARRRGIGDTTSLGWVVVLMALILGLALCSAGTDPGTPWWPAGLVVASSMLAFGLACRLRREGWAFAGRAGHQPGDSSRAMDSRGLASPRRPLAGMPARSARGRPGRRAPLAMRGAAAVRRLPACVPRGSLPNVICRRQRISCRRSSPGTGRAAHCVAGGRSSARGGSR